MKSKDSTVYEPSPKPSKGDVWNDVIEDMKARREMGIEKYGTPLQPNNGRDALVDAYQEALDLAVYLKQKIIENRGNRIEHSTTKFELSEDDVDFLTSCNLHPHSDTALKVLTDNDEGAYLDTESIIELISILQKYVGQKQEK